MALFGEDARALFRLAVRNVQRQRARTAMTLGAIAFGVAGLILSGGFVQDILTQLGEAVIHSQSGHLQISRAGFKAEGMRGPDQNLILDPNTLKGRIAGQAGISDVMARVRFSGLLNNGRSDLAILGEGIEPEQEAKLGSHIRIVAGRQLRESDRNGVMLGRGAANALKLAPGQRATLVISTAEGAANTLDVEVVGVFQTFSKDYDARALKIPLAGAYQAMADQGVNTIVVSLDRTPDTNNVAASLRTLLAGDGLEVRTWQELSDFYSKSVTLYDELFGVLESIILIMVLLSVANSVNMSLFERTAEFGTMRALGNRPRTVVALVVTETVLLGIIGSAIGVVVGVIAAAAISAVGIPMPPPPMADLSYTAQIKLVPMVVFGAFVIGVIATTLAGIVPARRAAKMPIVDALRQAT